MTQNYIETLNLNMKEYRLILNNGFVVLNTAGSISASICFTSCIYCIISYESISNI